MNKAQKIIESLMNSPELYRQSSKREGEVWGKIFSNKERQQRLIEDQKAAQQLNINRKLRGLPHLLKEHQIFPKNGCSLACGSGRLERQLMHQGVCQRFHGIDISLDALNEAHELAVQEKLDITYEQADLNFISLDKNRYDLVVAQNCLHHVLHLEHVADEIRDSLTPSGVLWIHDYVGETQFQYSEERLRYANSILKILSEEMRTDRVNNRIIDRIERKEPGTLISPFESIRSGEIIDIFLERFGVVAQYTTNSIMHLVCPPGVRSNYIINEERRTLFELIALVDEMLIEQKIILPATGQFLLRPK